MTIVPISKKTQQDIVATLEDLTAQAKAGKVSGLLFACHYSGTRHEMGVAGRYASDLLQAIGVSHQLLQKLTQLHEKTSSE